MKRNATLVACALSVIASASVAQPAPEENPYRKTIVSRNIFNLTSPRELAIGGTTPQSPPRISLQGFTSICGRPQVLLKVATPPLAGAAARETALVLSEGQRQGEVEVLKINHELETVRFNNHGTVQTLSLR